MQFSFVAVAGSALQSNEATSDELTTHVHAFSERLVGLMLDRAGEYFFNACVVYKQRGGSC